MPNQDRELEKKSEGDSLLNPEGLTNETLKMPNEVLKTTVDKETFERNRRI